MTRFFFFTKTDWPEPPRLRHQLAALLVKRGHEVVFFERPYNVLRPRHSTDELVPGVTFHRTPELFNHKLRFIAPIRIANAAFEKEQITKALSNIGLQKSDVVINFCYDYYFLRTIFPQHKIITVINDDFWCRAILGYQKPLVEALALTCKASDRVLVVSRPLQEQLSLYCEPEIFYPWSDVPYSSPRPDTKRTKLLFWGYINNRLNFRYLEMLAENIVRSRMELKIEFIGPVQVSIDSQFGRIADMPCVSVKGPSNIDDIDFGDVLAAIIPYVAGNAADDVTDIPNKAFPMLARGLPLLISGMPNFIYKPFVYRLGESWSESKSTIEALREEFWDQQANIEEFVNKNLEEDRYNQIISCIK